MNRKQIRWIIALMSMALIGIISLQVYWISHDIAIKEQQFDQAVNQAMNAIVDKIETREAFHIIRNRFIDFDPQQLRTLMMTNEMAGSPFEITDSSISIPETASGPPPIFDDLDNADINIEFHSPGNNQTILKFQHKNVYHRDSISEQRIKSSRITRISGDSAEVTIRMNEEKIKARMDKLNDVMRQMAVEFMGNEGGELQQRISQPQLDSLIRLELDNRYLNIHYNYAVLNGNTNKLAISKSTGSEEDLLKSKYKTLLFPNDVFSKPDYLILQFPGSMKYVLSSIWLMLTSSFVFTIIILFGFAYTIMVILRQKKLSDIKSDFINNMTHEFKTPIATISLAVDSIKDPRVTFDAEKLAYFTRIIREENKRMNSQVENVLRMAQLEKGELHLRTEEINLHSIINQAVELIALQVESRGGKITSELHATNPVITGDPMHLSNVIFNLLDNANKYSPLVPGITISSENSPHGLVISVTDHGIGMSKETQKKIFEKFYRVPTGNLHDIKGFGLGLSYVKAIVELHKGKIEVESETGKGSRFVIYLPQS
ncbi:MAG: HAMP domain-containing sensor histidine kinase [Bacteroidetes bacterium]|nr:HAMP domain-containing sensor histidine kinase [Bacteroidota bacterium]